MSDTKAFGERTYEAINFISLEHGYKVITLSIIESSPHRSMSNLLEPDEAIRLAEDLIRRAKLIKAELVK